MPLRIKPVCLRILGVALDEIAARAGVELDVKSIDDMLGEVIFQVEDAAVGVVVAVGPDGSTVRHAQQANGGADPSAVRLQITVDHGIDLELAPRSDGIDLAARVTR